MREALIRAAQAQPGDVSAMILKAAKRKPAAFGGWSVERQKKEGKRGRRSRS